MKIDRYFGEMGFFWGNETYYVKLLNGFRNDYTNWLIFICR